ncbi:MAG: hypothetical protein AVDCRST_MAG93-5834 [uncultured Chloroflexia bacterium]|uniref:RDD domain-containing protein n=1 Tax=uncultured Chloroflexia bacterium TaxID=1672391 RepID=A0A6J4L5P7_9CHLR|nr:MAG: hypothetical protein AVDCRST_MAG93-5834 [uncultured Chloroflexia bacterium]
MLTQIPSPRASGPDPGRPLARPLARILAFAVDYLVIAVYMASIAGIGFALRRTPSQEKFARLWTSPRSGQRTGFLTLTLPVVLYFAFLEGSPQGATVGKRVLGLRVVAEGNQPLPLRRSLVRSAAKFLPWELAHTCLWRIPGWPVAPEPLSFTIWTGFALVAALVTLYLGSLWSRLHQTLYDRLAGSYVIQNEHSQAERAV